MDSPKPSLPYRYRCHRCRLAITIEHWSMTRAEERLLGLGWVFDFLGRAHCPTCVGLANPRAWVDVSAEAGCGR